MFSRLEGVTWDKGVVYFTSTQGGGDRRTSRLGRLGRRPGVASGGAPGRCGPITRIAGILEVVYQSTSTADLRLPDNVTASPRGTLILCEDNAGPNRLQALTKWGDLVTFAERSDLPAVEFAGATFAPDGTTLFVNLNASSALSVAIWGPWHNLGI